jgi:ABC-type Fe3+ transport system substrate-binding protein
MRSWADATGVALALAVAATALLASRTAMAQSASDILNYKGPDRQQKLEEGARKEGTVVLYSAMIVNQATRPITEAFRKKYPFINIKYWRGDSSQIVTKVNAELQANALVVDVVEGSGLRAGIGESQAAVPYYTPLSDVLPKEYTSADRTAVIDRFRYIAVGYNTKLVPKDMAPKTYEDLLDPKWKGKMAWNANSDSSGAYITITALRAAWGEEKAEAYFAKLAKQDVAPLKLSNRAVMDSVIQGEYWLGIGISAHHPIISASKGAPSTTVMMDPTPALVSAVQITRGAPHPHAALLLADFMLSEESQQILQGAEYLPSHPKVPPLPQMNAIIPKKVGVSEVLITEKMLLEETEKSAQLFRKYFH